MRVRRLGIGHTAVHRAGVSLGKDVVICGSRDVSNHHAALDTILEVDVLIQGDIGPEVHKLIGSYR